MYKRSNSNLINTDFITYINVVNYFHGHNMYTLNSSPTTGNKTWRDKSTNKVVAQRLLHKDNDIYKVSNDILIKYNNKN